MVKFPQYTLSHEFIEGSPITYIPIPSTTDRYEKNCYIITIIPLRVCKTITIYKSQGITVGTGQAWKKVVVWIPTGIQRKTAGIEIVAFLRATGHTIFSIGNDLNYLDWTSLLKIGYGKASKVRKYL